MPGRAEVSRALSRPWFRLALLLVAGAVVYSPALRSRYFLDDYVQASMVRGNYPAPRAPWNLYDFINAADRAALQERGILPWWSDPRLSMRFFRPLSSSLVWAERTLFGDRPVVFHLHSLLWWAAAVLGARALFRRVLPARAARFATVIFAIAPCHALPLAWLANREALISLTFGVWALGAYLRWREGRALRDGALAAALFALSMLGGEYALCFTGYVAALELVGLRGRVGARALGLVPFVAPAAAYLGARAALDYGAHGSGFYADPFREPVLLLGWVPRRMATLLLDGWFALDHDTLRVETPWWVLGPAFVAAVALLAVPIRRTLGRLDEAGRRSAGWLLLGSVLAIGPVTAVISAPRLLGASMLGVAAVVGLLFDQAWSRSGAPGDEDAGDPAGRHAGAAALLLGFAHLVHAPVTSFLIARGFQREAVVFAEHAAELGARFPETRGLEVVVMRGMAGSFFLPWLDEHGMASARWRILAQTGHLLALRVDARTLDLVAPANLGIFPRAGAANLFRNERHPVAAGEVFTVPGLRATVLELGNEGPRRVRFEFDRDLESEDLAWISEDFLGNFHETRPPREGFGMPFDP